MELIKKLARHSNTLIGIAGIIAGLLGILASFLGPFVGFFTAGAGFWAATIVLMQGRNPQKGKTYLMGYVALALSSLALVASLYNMLRL